MPKNVKLSIISANLWILFGVSIGMFLKTISAGTEILELLKLTILGADFSIALRFDPLSAPLFLMVATLGIVICQYSKRYLNGEARQLYFYKYLLLIVLSVSLLILSNNLIVFAGMWILISHFLNRLLLFYSDRPDAQSAASKKRIVSLVSNISLLVAVTLVYVIFGSTDFNIIFAFTANPAETAPYWAIECIAGLLVIAAAAKSALFPFHFWLPETMETPTPVSALMHAGIINAGGFLILRFSPLIEGAVWSHAALILMGSFTAVYASLVMITQNNIKSKLAFSTISQMGLMLFACGLGAYSIALFHIIAHSFYKSYAFLSTGTLIEESKKIGYKLTQPSLNLTIFYITLGAGLIWLGYVLFQGAYLAFFTYLAIMLLAFAQNKVDNPVEGYNSGFAAKSVAGILAAGCVGYLILESSVAYFLEGVVPGTHVTSLQAQENIVIIAISFALFAAGFVASTKLVSPQSEPFKKLYIHLWNRGYFKLQSDKWLGSSRHWET